MFNRISHGPLSLSFSTWIMRMALEMLRWELELTTQESRNATKTQWWWQCKSAFLLWPFEHWIYSDMAWAKGSINEHTYDIITTKFLFKQLMSKKRIQSLIWPFSEHSEKTGPNLAGVQCVQVGTPALVRLSKFHQVLEMILLGMVNDRKVATTEGGSVGNMEGGGGRFYIIIYDWLTYVLII